MYEEVQGPASPSPVHDGTYGRTKVRRVQLSRLPVPYNVSPKALSFRRQIVVRMWSKSLPDKHLGAYLRVGDVSEMHGRLRPAGPTGSTP